jgi:hypothetical protein
MGELQRGRVGPVEVFDRDDRRRARRQRFDEDPNGLERPLLQGLGRTGLPFRVVLFW